MCALVCISMLVVSLIRATTADEAQTPLAESRLQQVPVDPQPEMQNGLMLEMSLRPAAIMTTNYRRGPTGDWEVPSEVDADDSHVRLLVVTPSGPLLVDLSILVDGVSFSTTREGWITDALTGKPDAEPEPEARPQVEEIVTEATKVVVEDDAPDAEAESETDEVAGTSAERFEPAVALTRLQKYAAQPGLNVGRDEARWLLAQWSPGPTLLELRPTFAAERSRLAPLWVALDADRDGELSKAEIASAQSRLRALDVDEDDWVDESELTASPLVAMWSSFPVTNLLDDTTDWTRLARQLREAFADEAPAPLVQCLLNTLQVASLSKITPRVLSRLVDAAPQLFLRVELGTDDKTSTGLFVVKMANELVSADASISAVTDVVSLALPSCVIELSAAQPAPANNKSNWNGQVAVGAVLDGSPLLRRVDLDRDHRLSLREAETVAPMLATLDQDGDGLVRMAEIPVPLRLTVTLGPHAHTMLDQPSVAPQQTRPADIQAAPPWFASMDLNRDGDLTPAEFLGTRAQFDQLDLDQNQRVSTTEAAKSVE